MSPLSWSFYQCVAEYMSDRLTHPVSPRGETRHQGRNNSSQKGGEGAPWDSDRDRAGKAAKLLRYSRSDFGRKPVVAARATPSFRTERQHDICSPYELRVPA